MLQMMLGKMLYLSDYNLVRIREVDKDFATELGFKDVKEKILKFCVKDNFKINGKQII